MECENLPAPQTWDQSTPEEIQVYRLHVRFCRTCRARVLAKAPDQLLFDLRSEPLPEDFWLGFWNSIDQKRSTPGNLTASRSHPAVRWAAVLVIGFFLLLYGRNLPETDPVRQMELESYPVIENIGNPEARYYIFQSGQREKIVMVFDPDMEL